MTLSEIRALPVGAEFNFRGYSATKMSTTKIRVVYPMRSATYIPIDCIKEYIKE